MYDLKADQHEMNNLYDDPANAELIGRLKQKLIDLPKRYQDATGNPLAVKDGL